MLAYRISFEEVCSHIAIAQTSDRAALIDSLIGQTFVIIHPTRLSSREEIASNLLALFSVPLDNSEILIRIDCLLEKRSIIRQSSGSYLLDASLFDSTSSAIENAHSLEDMVKAHWQDHVKATFPQLSGLNTWPAIKSYLFAVFRRHGIQAAALLDPRIGASPEQLDSLGSILHKIAVTTVSGERCDILKHAITDFMRASGSSSAFLSRYISRLANAAYNYYSLQAPPEVAQRVRAALDPMVIFLDTNFLFGLLDLHVNSQVRISEHLIASCIRHKLPFRFRYLEITRKEFAATLTFYSRNLRGRNWPRAVSRAALNSPMLSGIELRYHQLNAETTVDPDVFLSKYEHFDVLLKQRGIEIYRMEDDYSKHYSPLYRMYADFLERRKKQKPDESIHHDATALEIVENLRVKSDNILGAGFLFLTCDFYLQRFSTDYGRIRKQLSAALLPNLFWELLRPFIADEEGFDEAFAETFALPEFQSIEAGAAAACSRLLGILAAYKDMSEEAATRLLASSLLLDRLRFNKPNEEEVHELIESELISFNATILEEKAAAEMQATRDIQLAEEAANRKEAEMGELLERLRAVEQRSQELEASLDSAREREEHHLRELSVTRQISEENREVARSGEQKLEALAQQANHMTKYLVAYKWLASLLIGMILLGGVEWWLETSAPAWLAQHNKRYVFDIGLIVLISSVVLGWNVVSVRKEAWFGVGGGIILVVLSLI